MTRLDAKRQPGRTVQFRKKRHPQISRFREGGGVKPRLKPVALLACLLPVLAGCGTLANTFEPEPQNKVYVGVRADIGAIGHGGFLDLPFSLVLDTVLLPYTIPKTIANRAAKEEARPEEAEPGGAGTGGAS